MKKVATLVGTALLVAGMALAQEASGFDPSALIESAGSTVTGIASAVGSVLIAASAIYLAFIGWRKFREACNRV